MRLFLFTTDADLAARAEAAGVDSVVVDWETKNKADRQRGHDLELNADGPEDVRRLSARLKIPVTVRINAPGPQTAEEVDRAIDAGARIVMLPMARHPREVAEFLDLLRGRAESLVQIETQSLAEQAAELRGLPWKHAYIGLNDLMLSRGATSLWDSILDGTVERICRSLEGLSYGFGGVTVLGGGFPVRYSLLASEMARLRCSMSILRRTFKKEILDRDMEAEIRAVRDFQETLRRRGPKAVEEDHRAFFAELRRVAGA